MVKTKQHIRCKYPDFKSIPNYSYNDGESIYTFREYIPQTFTIERPTLGDVRKLWEELNKKDKK